IQSNQKRVVNEGRKPGLELHTPDGEMLGLRDWGEQLLLAMEPVARLLDHSFETTDYIDSWNNQLAKVQNTENTLSAKVLQTLREQQLSFFQWAKNSAEAQKQRYLLTPLSEEVE